MKYAIMRNLKYAAIKIIEKLFTSSNSIQQAYRAGWDTTDVNGNTIFNGYILIKEFQVN